MITCTDNCILNYGLGRCWLLAFKKERQTAIHVLHPSYDGSSSKLRVENEGESGEGEEKKQF